MIKAIFTKRFWDIRKRIKSLPKYLEKSIKTIAEDDAKELIKVYQDGIREDSFDLTRLTKISIDQKIKKGYKKPTTPLYGAGDDEDNSLINAFEVKKKFFSYHVVLRDDKHHEANLPLSVLFKIHEFGVLIRVTEKMHRFLPVIGMYKKVGDYVRIPPRPRRAKTWKRFLNHRLKQEKYKEVRQHIINLKKTLTDKRF
jgi:hypothetical protein